jgi:hypothetical protein
MFKKETLKPFIIPLSIVLLISAVTVGVFAFKSNKKAKPEPEKQAVTNNNNDVKENPQFKKYTKELPSRAWMEYAMDIIREEKPTPPESSRFYAYVSLTYATALEQKMSDRGAGESVRTVINQIYPKRATTTSEFLEYLHPYDVQKYGTGVVSEGVRSTISNDEQANAINAILEREKNDGFYDIKWDEVIPKGDGFWTKISQPPFSPTAGEWKRWIVKGDFKVAAPPKIGSVQDKQEIEKVKKATETRSAEQSALINFWGGVPGTEAPAGIWQNRMYDEIIKKDKKSLTDEEYAKYQSILAQSLADSFMECWKVKYTYWTARPSMRIENLNTAMNNPNFPSYVSGHSTISSTAAQVLGTFFPEKKAIWVKDAENARDSRLWAGIHFDVDNQEGFKLGEMIGKDIVSKINIDTLSIETATEKNLLNKGKLTAEIRKTSHLNDGEKKGDILLVSPKDDTSKKFVLANSIEDKSKIKLESGWESQTVGTDSIWVPGACSSMPTAFAGGKYVVMFDLGSSDNGIQVNDDGASVPQILRLLAYDTKTKEFKYILNQSTANFKNNDEIYSYTLRNAGDKNISYYYIPKANLVTKESERVTEKYFKSVDVAYVVKRVLNIETLEYKDYKISLPGWKSSYATSAVNFHTSGGEIMINIGYDSNDYFTLEDNEINLNKRFNSENMPELYVDSYRIEEIGGNREGQEEILVRILDKNNKEYYKTKVTNLVGLEIKSATKDKIFLARPYNGAQMQSYTELGYLNINSKEYTPGVKSVIKEVNMGGNIYNEPEFTFFIVGML